MVCSLSRFKSNVLKDKTESWKFTVLRDLIYQGVQISIKKGQVEKPLPAGFCSGGASWPFKEGRAQRALAVRCYLMKKAGNTLAVKREAWSEASSDAAWGKVTLNILISIRIAHFSLQKAFSYEMLSCLGYCVTLMQENRQIRMYTVCCVNHIVYDFGWVFLINSLQLPQWDSICGCWDFILPFRTWKPLLIRKKKYFSFLFQRGKVLISHPLN